MKDKIDSLKKRLNRQIEIDGIRSEKVLELSQKLDILIFEYYKKMENDMFNKEK